MTDPASDPAAKQHLSEGTLKRVLAPYLPDCRYVKSALLVPNNGQRPKHDAPATWLRLEAECAIESSCYIESTGHFNAVELNITYNQLLYLCLAESLRLGLLPQPAWSFDDFFRHQLPNVLIGDYRSRFRRPMQSRYYTAWLEITAAQARDQRNLMRLKTRCGCTDSDRDACEAEVTIALLGWPSA